MTVHKVSPYTHQNCRSLLQKAVRRGCISLIPKVVNHLVEVGDTPWLVSRTGVIVFEESWPLGILLDKELNTESITQILIETAISQKQKDAAGLGSLSYEFSKGDSSDFTNSSSFQPVQDIAEAIQKPEGFWQRMKDNVQNQPQKEMLIDKAYASFKRAGWPWDRAFMQAAAYLATMENIPTIEKCTSLICSENDFPFWIAIDKHTEEGKQAIKKVAEKVGINARKVSWISFYFSSAVENEMLPSPWWKREMDWRLYKIGLSRFEAEKLWMQIKPRLFEELFEKGEQLQSHISTNHEKDQETIQLSFF